MPQPLEHQLKCDARDTIGSTIFSFGGVGDKYPSSVGRVSRFSGFAFSVSGIGSSPTATRGSVAQFGHVGQTIKAGAAQTAVESPGRVMALLRRAGQAGSPLYAISGCTGFRATTTEPRRSEAIGLLFHSKSALRRIQPYEASDYSPAAPPSS
jgi:hypothetical protein